MRMLIMVMLILPGRVFAQTPSATEVINQWISMWNTYDLSMVDSLFDKYATYFSSEYDGLIEGLEKLREHHRKFGFVDGGKTTGNTLWLENLKERPVGAAALLVTGTWYFRRIDSVRPQTGPVTFLLGKVSGRWKILHAHFANSP
ncbi:MAG: hypothetical protein RMK43_10965 [Cyclobacteriaceae bacterium]|nr:hypothetical protein [Cyclobacteriaceae bacterium]